MPKHGDPIWRQPGTGPNGSEGVTVRRQLFTAHHYTRTNGNELGGGQILVLTADNIEGRAYRRPSQVVAFSVARSLKPIARLGDAVIVEWAAGDANTVVALHDGQFGGGHGPAGSQEASVQRGEFFASQITENLWNL